MSDERFAAIEASCTALRDAVEARSSSRDQQLGALATENATLRAELNALTGRVELVEIASRPPSILSIWGPAVGTLSIALTVGGAFLTVTQREQDAKLDIVQSHVDANTEKIDALRVDSRFLDAQIRITERDFRGALATVAAKVDMLEKQVDDVDLRGSRKWVGK